MMSTTSAADLAQGFVQQHGDQLKGFWSKAGGLRNQISRWLADLETEAVDRGIDDPLQGHHGLVDAVRNADVDELELRVKAILDPDSLKDADPTTLPTDLYGRYRQQMMPANPGGLGSGALDQGRGAVVTQRRYAGAQGLYGH